MATGILLIALGLIVLASALFPNFNAGILAMSAAFLLGPMVFDAAPTSVMQLFPHRLFFVVFGLSLFFSMLTINGTVERTVALLLRMTGGRVVLMPLVIFGLVVLLTTMGVSNIAATAVTAPIAMKLAASLGLSPFLMAILIVGAANGASFSPLSLAGAIVMDFVSNHRRELHLNDEFSPWNLYGFSMVAQGMVAFLAFHLMGGTRWVRENFRRHLRTNNEWEALPLERKHVLSLMVFLLFMASVTLPQFSLWKDSVPRSIAVVTENVAVPALLAATLLMVMRVADAPSSLKIMPWNTLILIVGMSLFVEFADHVNVLPDVSRAIVQNASSNSVFFLFPMAAGFLSAFSSSTGVVLPLFLPLIVSFQGALPNVKTEDLLAALAVSSHLVDASPLSTLGALCVSAVHDEHARTRLFQSLLRWGFLLIPVGAVLSWVYFSW